MLDRTWIAFLSSTLICCCQLSFSMTVTDGCVIHSMQIHRLCIPVHVHEFVSLFTSATASLTLFSVDPVYEDRPSCHLSPCDIAARPPYRDNNQLISANGVRSQQTTEGTGQAAVHPAPDRTTSRSAFGSQCTFVCRRTNTCP